MTIALNAYYSAGRSGCTRIAREGVQCVNPIFQRPAKENSSIAGAALSQKVLWGSGTAISINGGRPTSNNYTLDGLVNTDTALNTPAVILSQDAIQEFKVQSETYSAEYGFSANQVNIVSKSRDQSIARDCV